MNIEEKQLAEAARELVKHIGDAHFHPIPLQNHPKRSHPTYLTIQTENALIS